MRSEMLSEKLYWSVAQPLHLHPQIYTENIFHQFGWLLMAFAIIAWKIQQFG